MRLSPRSTLAHPPRRHSGSSRVALVLEASELRSYIDGWSRRLVRWSANRSASATIVKVGMSFPGVGNTELPAT